MVYAFGLTPRETEVLDPSVGAWTPLSVPADPLDLQLYLCPVTPVPDPSRGRILVKLKDSSSKEYLFAFYPDAPSYEQWKCIAQDFYHWVGVSAILDDIMYFHGDEDDPSIRAFDLVKGKWLNVCQDDTNTRRRSTALFHLGGNVLCSAGWFPQPVHNKHWFCRITFSELFVVRSGAYVTISCGTSHSYTIPATLSVEWFLPIYMEQPSRSIMPVSDSKMLAIWFSDDRVWRMCSPVRITCSSCIACDWNDVSAGC